MAVVHMLACYVECTDKLVKTFWLFWQSTRGCRNPRRCWTASR